MSAARRNHNRRKVSRRNARMADAFVMVAVIVSGLAAFSVLALSFI